MVVAAAVPPAVTLNVWGTGDVFFNIYRHSDSPTYPSHHQNSAQSTAHGCGHATHR